jgi:hypothetical protein
VLFVVLSWSTGLVAATVVKVTAAALWHFAADWIRADRQRRQTARAEI